MERGMMIDGIEPSVGITYNQYHLRRLPAPTGGGGIV